MTHPDVADPIRVSMTEWSSVNAAVHPGLKNVFLGRNSHLRALIDSLRERVDIRQGYDGLEISSTSFVGHIDVGPLRISITPKLPSLPLAVLLRYAYGLRDLARVDETFGPTERHGLQDLLITLLAAEVEEQLHRGLPRLYVPLEQKLESPRGRLLINQIIRDGGIREPRIACRYNERKADWHLNQILRSGLEAAATMTDDLTLRRHVHHLAAMFDEVQVLRSFSSSDIDRAERELSRLTEASRPSLTILRLLQDARGVAFAPTQDLSKMPGFLFDMNMFFQRLLSRFLKENLSTVRIEDELPIRDLFAYAKDANPKKRQVPKPRPDYAVFRGKSLIGFVDAKYRDIWTRDLPAPWLYQLSIYSLASPSRTSVILYASMEESARDEKIEIRPPLDDVLGTHPSVVLRPVPLATLADLVSQDGRTQKLAKRRQFAESLIRPFSLSEDRNGLSMIQPAGALSRRGSAYLAVNVDEHRNGFFVLPGKS